MMSTITDTSERLAVYGTLAPGRPNEQVLADVRGEWSKGWVEGDFVDHSWGASESYPAMRPREGGSRIDVDLFESAELPRLREQLDDFEGDGYERVPIPVHREAHPPVVGHNYAARLPEGR